MPNVHGMLVHVRVTSFLQASGIHNDAATVYPLLSVSQFKSIRFIPIFHMLASPRVSFSDSLFPGLLFSAF